MPVQNAKQPPQSYVEPARNNIEPPQTNAAPSQDPPQSQTGGTGSWSVGAKVWFALVILGYCALFTLILIGALPTLRMHPEWQWPLTVLGITDAVMIALYVWVYVSKTKNALTVLLCIAAIAALKSLADGEIVTAVSDIAAPAITWLIARKVVS